MKFSELDKLVPYITDGKEKSIRIRPYSDVHILMPGRHADQTTPAGGDGCVVVTDDNVGWTDHQFTHSDIFSDIQLKSTGEKSLFDFFILAYMDTVLGESPEDAPWPKLPGLHSRTFLRAAQCLALTEHRRYARFESQLGGRYLPLRFAHGIAEGRWTAADATQMQSRGRPGVERLERRFGVPSGTVKLRRRARRQTLDNITPTM